MYYFHRYQRRTANKLSYIVNNNSEQQSGIASETSEFNATAAAAAANENGDHDGVVGTFSGFNAADCLALGDIESNTKKTPSGSSSSSVGIAPKTESMTADSNANGNSVLNFVHSQKSPRYPAVLPKNNIVSPTDIFSMKIDDDDL